MKKSNCVTTNGRTFPDDCADIAATPPEWDLTPGLTPMILIKQSFIPFRKKNSLVPNTFIYSKTKGFPLTLVTEASNLYPFCLVVFQFSDLGKLVFRAKHL